MNTHALARYMLELGHLKYVPRSGWGLLGMRVPESVAEHTARAAQIAYILASLEGYPRPAAVAVMLLFHDSGEARTNDPNKVNQQYVRADEAQAITDATRDLGPIGQTIRAQFNEYKGRSSAAAIIAKDADHLDMMLTAMELVEQGFATARLWFDRTVPLLRTKSAQRLADELTRMSASDWWHAPMRE